MAHRGTQEWIDERAIERSRGREEKTRIKRLSSRDPLLGGSLTKGVEYFSQEKTPMRTNNIELEDMDNYYMDNELKIR